MSNNEKATNQFIDKILDSNILPWEMPWDITSAKSLSSNKNYDGAFNKMRLRFEQFINEYKSSFWGTFNQFKKLNRSIKKGQKNTTIFSMFNVYYKNNKKVSYRIYNKMTESEKKDIKISKGIGTICVWNLDQTHGEKIPEKFKEEQFEKISINQIDNVLESMPKKPEIKHGFNKACYFPSLHSINMPHQGDFIKKAIKQYNDKSLGIPFYYSTKIHEIAHSTGHKDLLNRSSLVNNYGNKNSKEYAFEEMVAEFTTHMIMCQFNISVKETEKNQVAYIQGWLDAHQINIKDKKDEQMKFVKENKELLVKACTDAEKATNWIMQKEVKKKKVA